MHSNRVKETRESGAIAALKKGKVFAPLTFEGSCNRDLFETWRFEKFDIVILGILTGLDLK